MNKTLKLNFKQSTSREGHWKPHSEHTYSTTVYKQSWTLGSTHLKEQLSLELRDCLDEHGAKDLLDELEAFVKDELFWIGSKQRELILKDIKILKELLVFGALCASQLVNAMG